MNFGWAEPVLDTKSSSGFVLSSSYKTNRLNPKRACCGTALAQSCFTRWERAELDLCVFAASPAFIASFVCLSTRSYGGPKVQNTTHMSET